MVITFGYFDAGNDWWWAIDNLKVFQAYSVGSVEGFDGLALGPNVDEELAGDAVWTKTPPGGWSITIRVFLSRYSRSGWGDRMGRLEFCRQGLVGRSHR